MPQKISPLTWEHSSSNFISLTATISWVSQWRNWDPGWGHRGEVWEKPNTASSLNLAFFKSKLFLNQKNVLNQNYYPFVQMDLIAKKGAEKDIHCSIIYDNENVEITCIFNIKMILSKL